MNEHLQGDEVHVGGEPGGVACPQCRVDLSGLADEETCPECGALLELVERIEQATDAAEDPEAALAAEAPVRPGRRRKRRSLLFDVIRVSMGAFAHVGLTFIIGIIMVRYWGRDAKGLVVAIMNVPTIICLASEMGLKKIIPYMIGQQVESTQRVISIGFSLWLATSALGLSIAFGFFFMYGVEGAPMMWCVLAALSIVPRLLINQLRGIALGVEEIGYFNQLRYFRDTFLLMVVAGAVFLLGLKTGMDHAWIYIAGMLFTSVFVVGWGVPMVRRHAQISFGWDHRLVRDMVLKGVVFSLGSFLMLLNYSVDIFIMTLYLKHPEGIMTPEEINDYSLGVAFANLLWQFPIVMGTILFSRSVNAKDPLAMARTTARLIRVGTVLAIPAAVVLWILAPWIFPFLYGEKVIHSAPVLRILMPGIVAFFAARMIESDLTGKGRPWAVVSVMAPVVIANILLNVIFIPIWGVNGAAFTSALTYTLGSAGMVIVYSRVTGLPVMEIVMPRRSDFVLKLGRKGRGGGKGGGNGKSGGGMPPVQDPV